MNLKASLVMATLGRVAEIDRCVDSLAAQTRRDFELIVVDQNPDERLVPVVARARALGLACHHLRQVEPNLCKARNAGIEHAQGEVVAFPDDDCWYEPDVVERVLAAFSEQPALDGLVACWVEARQVPSGPVRFAEFARFRGPTASSITLFLRADPLRKIGGFDLALGLHSWYGAGEETDLMLSLLAKGAVIEGAPDIRVHHAWATPVSLPSRQMFTRARLRSRGTGALYARHPLPLWVIARGLLSPWVGMPAEIRRPRALAQKLGLALGRLEGYIGWRIGRSPLKTKRVVQ